MTAKDIEIMAPVGSYESLMAAIQGGANAVYFGIGKLNMRSRSSKNFTLDDLAEISKICHQNNIRSYITLNTVIFDKEIDEVKEIINAAKQNEITAIIASDISVIQYARSQNVEVHMSTQTNITNIEAVQFWSLFADVMVTARELSLEQVADITRQIEERQIKGPSGKLIQIEIFAHGALCMAVSGKCYLSLDNMNHSANRGACLQLCRRGYKVTDLEGEHELEIDNEYIMSPKDLKTIGFLDKILKAGVKVLKIEGRGRSADYVKVVSQCYREAANAVFEGNYTPENIAIWEERLKGVYNRGFWDGYYLGKKLGEWTENYGSLASKKKVYAGVVTNYFTKLGVAEIKLEAQDLNIGDDIQIHGPTTGVYEATVSEIRLELEPVSKAEKGSNCSIPVKDIVRRMDKVYKIVSAIETDELLS
jgi:putative protease